jgi:hypothetical protein
MDTSGCQAQFPEVELSRLLPPKSLSLYHRLQQAAEIALANIEGLETCPACDYAVIIDDPQEKLFRCQKDGCRKVTCRQCRREVSELAQGEPCLLTRAGPPSEIMCRCVIQRVATSDLIRKRSKRTENWTNDTWLKTP